MYRREICFAVTRQHETYVTHTHAHGNSPAENVKVMPTRSLLVRTKSHSMHAGCLPVIARRATATCSHRWQVFISTARTEAAPRRSTTRGSHRHTGDHHSRRQLGVNGTMRNYSAPHLPPLARHGFLHPAGANPLACPNESSRSRGRAARRLQSYHSFRAPEPDWTGRRPGIHRRLALNFTPNRPSARSRRPGAANSNHRGIYLFARAARASENFHPGCRFFFPVFFFFALSSFPYARRSRCVGDRRRLVGKRLSITACANERGANTNGGF